MSTEAAIDPDAGAELLRALAHPTRLALLASLTSGERSVGEIAIATGVAQPGLSQQLAVLRDAGLVTTRREAKQVFYSLDRNRLGEVGALVDALVGANPTAGEPARLRPLLGGDGAAMFARLL